MDEFRGCLEISKADFDTRNRSRIPGGFRKLDCQKYNREQILSWRKHERDRVFNFQRVRKFFRGRNI